MITKARVCHPFSLLHACMLQGSSMSHLTCSVTVFVVLRITMHSFQGSKVTGSSSNLTDREVPIIFLAQFVMLAIIDFVPVRAVGNLMT